MDEHRNDIFKPDYAVHPGMLLEQELEHRQLSQADFARRIGRTPKLVSDIISGKNPREPETAIQFEKVSGIGADVWLRMEAQFRLHEARRAECEKLAAAEQWLDEFPVKQLVEWRVIRKSGTTAERAHDLLALFGVASPAAFEQRYAKVVVHYRRSQRMQACRTSLLTWLRVGEVCISAENIRLMIRRNFKISWMKSES
jgi:HTH-type transcriptional regulator/antitoxin HigA